MEKFAVDLDKVLDDFEFNEDCAEQVVSVAVNSADILDQEIKGKQSPHKPINDADEETIHQNKVKINSAADIQKPEVIHNNGGSINDFCTRKHQINDNKIQEKNVVRLSDIGESASLTIYNDITHKLVQKRQNQNQMIKSQNSYDKKLNQPNIKPSVSNVFNSLNEYINASSANTECTSYSTDSNKEKNITKVERSADNKETPISQIKKIQNVLPAYQNILLPLKCESSNDTQSTEKKKIDDCSSTAFNRNITPMDRSTHVYENVPIGESSSTARQLSKDMSNSSSKDEPKHVYENVDFRQQHTSTEEKLNYECIYTGKAQILSEMPKSDIVHKRLAEQPSANAMYSSDKAPPTIENETIACSNTSSTSQTFQNVNLTSTEERKSVGFTTIDDLSEEELNKYLAELEAEERARDEGIIYENVSVPGSSSFYHYLDEQRKKQLSMSDDEDANEAPIFESVTIGEIPKVPDEKLQEKAKKLRVIDYSTSGVKTDTSDVLEKKTLGVGHENVRVISEVKKKNPLKTSVNVNKNSSNSGNVTELNINETVRHYENNEPVENVEKYSISDSVSNSIGTPETSANNEDPDVCSKPISVASQDLTKNLSDSLTPGDNCDDITKSTTIDNIKNGESLSTEKGEKAEESQKLEDNCEKLSRPQTLDVAPLVPEHESSIPDSSDVTVNVPSNASANTQDHDTSTNEASHEHQREPSPDVSDNSSLEFGIILGKQPPFWVPDSDAPNCMLCDVKFNVIKRRHHCRACGKVLCNKCCSMKFRLEYQGNMDSRVCAPCYQQLIRAENESGSEEWSLGCANTTDSTANSPQGRQPNPNNPMEYCSTIPPLQQLAGNLPPPPTVMVPVGVLKRDGSTKQRTEAPKSVIFSDGIRPGCDLTELDTSWDFKPPYRKLGNRRITSTNQQPAVVARRQNLPPLDPCTNSYIPQDINMLPPTVTIHKGQTTYQEVVDQAGLYKALKNECEPPVMFAINRNLYAYVKITNLNCCVNKTCWNVTSRGLACVGQDEIILLVETLPDEIQVPRDLLVHINQIYMEAIKGNTITELGVSIHQDGNLLGSREHSGFLFVRQTFQCLQKIILPPAPFLVGLLVHRWETPWAKIFPLRLLLRLGAEYRYYPCPLVSVRFRDAVYFEIGHTIMKVLADFRNYAYSLPGVRGMVIHMQDRTTDVLFPRNRYDQVIKALNNSNDHVLAFAANFSIQADSHLVCIQTNTGDESSYQTQAINIHNKPRKVTGASFIVINGALKSSMGLSAKSSIVEDGLMVQIMPEKMEALKAALKSMQDFVIDCGRQGASTPDETVNIKWTENDVQFNLGLKSPIDGKPMDGIPSIRVHNGTDYMGTTRFIRWTEVFIIEADDHPNGVHDPIDINKLSENVARATCLALVKLLDLLAAAGLTKLAVRAIIHPDNVGYEAGSEGTRLPPIYMNSLDNELIQVLHKAAQNSQDANTVLELIFHILDD